ncbi:hypothetical protein CLW00_106267 [Mongoliibacter ruber]|uniref:Uncharacterized protein n=1 Tax=Mongoliibacter ruber TaxID=1750599 RepID=A0A2T0WLQ6_9BACT|nr:hypothetical protein CLW00_106267 [Mongoliibacter ruber]
MWNFMKYIYNYLLFNSYSFFKKEERHDPLEWAILYMTLTSMLFLVPLIFIFRNNLNIPLASFLIIGHVLSIFIIQKKYKIENFKSNRTKFSYLEKSKPKVYNGFIAFAPVLIGFLILILLLFIL